MALCEICHYQKLTERLCSKRLFMKLIKEICRDSIVVRNGSAYHWQNAAIGTVQEMAKAFLVRDFKSELPSVFLYYIIPTYCYIVALMCAIHAKCITITLKNMELVDSLRVMNSGKSYHK